MLVSYLWLKDWVEHSLSAEDLATALTSLGLETSISVDMRGAFENVVVGRVEECGKHPSADKLSLTKVSTGNKVWQIVCGAPNVAAGQTVAVALPGSRLPGGLVIEKRKLRGEVSEGMICSESELGISVESSGIMVLDSSLKPGTPISECLEVEDVVLEVDLTPNRGDCLGLVGIAREVAAFTGAGLKLPDYPDEPSEGIEGLEVRIDDPIGCPRYTARKITGVKIAPSPVKIRRRLAAAGIRPINNVVDVTNYVMLETGHPLHAFDMKDITGNVISARNASEGERFATLDGKEHTLSADNLVIADAERAVALAGVMGGKNSEVKDDTSDIILEVAYFDPVSTRKTSRATGLSTESSYRFERGVNPETVPFASHRAAELLARLAGGTTRGYVDVYPEKVEFPSVIVRTQRVNDIIGVSLDDSKLRGILQRYGFDFKEEGKGNFLVHVPPYRHDMRQEIDVIEDVARLVGYDNIPSTIARLAQHEAMDSGTYHKRRSFNRLMEAGGFTEAVNYSFINPAWREYMGMGAAKAAALRNPISADMAELRMSLLPGLLNALSLNLRQGEEKISLFETGAVFHPADGAVEEEFLSAGVMTGGKEDIFGISAPRDFFRLKGVLSKVIKGVTGVEPGMERPARPHDFLYDHRQVNILSGGHTVGFMGQLHTLTKEKFGIECDILCFEISLDRLFKSPAGRKKFHPLPKYPGIKRDLAFLVDEKEDAGAIINTIIKSDPRVRSCRIFDLYKGKQIPDGKKSLAFGLFFQEKEGTLTDEAGDGIVESIVKKVMERHNAQLRS